MTSPNSKRRFVRTALATGVSALSVAAACMTPRPAAAPAQQPAPAPTARPAAAPAQRQGEVYPLRALRVSERPVVLMHAAMQFPDSLLSAIRRIGGRVVYDFVIDTNGLAVPGSVRILSSSDPRFEAVIREQVMGERWRPGRIDGRAVAVRFPPIPLDFPAASRLPATEPIAEPGAAELPPGVYAEDSVTERPRLLRYPALRYPDSLRTAGIGGRVVIEGIVDSTGHVDSASVRILSSTHPAFEAPAREAVLGATLVPGRLHGRVVPVMVRFPLAFSIARP